MAVKAVNDTAGPEGLVPTLLVFGTYPRLSSTSPPSPSIATRANAIKKAMMEVRQLKAKRQISEALATRNGPNTLETLNLPLQSEVKVWREKIGWKGPFLLILRDGETYTVKINGKPTNFRTVMVKPYYRDHNNLLEAGHDNAEEEEDSMADREDDMEDRDWTPKQQPQQIKKRRGRPPRAKNKPKTSTLANELIIIPVQQDIDAAIMTGTTLTEAYLIAKEHANYELAI